ncbi:hypothetical protein GCM10009759_74300 [Kitasatospora saccharophila]|uniref:DDE family transposase n=1 Tax=Kitasatospora saccharophila TaxID=407973 RepID=A0ABP5JVP8_9ACTN
MEKPLALMASVLCHKPAVERWASVTVPVTALGVATAVAWSADTHAILDRRWPVRLILERAGAPKFTTLQSGGISGPYLADQALHATTLLGSAIMLVRL